MPKPDVERKLPPIVNFDLYGHCVLCHINMLEDKYVDGKMIIRLTAQAVDTSYLLNTGSYMNVTMCRKCKVELKDTESEYNAIMASVILGWEIEYTDLVASASKPQYTETIKAQYMEEQHKKKIVIRTELLEPDAVMKHFEKFKLKEKKKKKDK